MSSIERSRLSVPALNAGARRSNGAGLMPYLYLLPAVLSLGMFTFYPLLQTLHISVSDYNIITQQGSYVGFKNFAAVLSDSAFQAVLWQSLAYLVLGVISYFLLPVGLALLTLQLREKEAQVMQTVLFLPAVVAVSIGSLIWLWFYLPAGGVLNELLTYLHLHQVNWLNERSSAIVAVSLVGAWKFMGFNYLVALSGLGSIPSSYIEAAQLDGAEPWTLLRHVILPMFAPSAVFIFLSALLSSMENTFIPIDILTTGGPAGGSTHLMYSIYQEAFKFFRAGNAAAQSVILMLIFGGLILWQFRLMERYTSYDRS